MKQYVIDELRFDDYTKLKDYFEKNFICASVSGVYWILIDDDMLSHTQSAHMQCKPFYFSVELDQQAVTFELLVRTKNNIRCNCIAYATKKQRNWCIDFADVIFEKLDIIT